MIYVPIKVTKKRTIEMYNFCLILRTCSNVIIFKENDLGAIVIN